MKILKMYFEVIYCEVNKESNLITEKYTYNPCKLPKKRLKYAKIALTVLVTQ
jgi:hypothetical protein